MRGTVSLDTMPSVALVTTDPEFIGHEDTDLVPLLSALRTLGLNVSVLSWHDSTIDWSDFDLAIMRSPWDYAEQLPQFLDWLDRTSAQTRILNPPEIIRWNLDKRYLSELHGQGVRIVESHFCTSSEEVIAAIALIDAERVVVKPSVSAGSRNTGLFEKTDARAQALATRILALGKTVMIQPAIDSVTRVGEQALVYFDGRFSHALTKGPILDLGGELLGGVYQEQITSSAATAAQLALAERTMRAITALFMAHGLDEDDALPLYARLDMVETGSGPALLEAELFEPLYFVGTSQSSEHRFAAALLARLASHAQILGAQAK
jgi:hypothetical protein